MLFAYSYSKHISICLKTFQTYYVYCFALCFICIRKLYLGNHFILAHMDLLILYFEIFYFEIISNYRRIVKIVQSTPVSVLPNVINFTCFIEIHLTRRQIDLVVHPPQPNCRALLSPPRVPSCPSAVNLHSHPSPMQPLICFLFLWFCLEYIVF